MQCSIMHQILCPKFAFSVFFMVEIYEKLFVKPRFCPALVHVYMHPHYVHQSKPCELLSLKHTILYSDHIFIMNPALEFYVCLLLNIDNYNHCFSSIFSQQSSTTFVNPESIMFLEYYWNVRQNKIFYKHSVNVAYPQNIHAPQP